MEYEYITVQKEVGVTIVSFLNEIGINGWELCGISGYDSDFIFKRLKRTEKDPEFAWINKGRREILDAVTATIRQEMALESDDPVSDFYKGTSKAYLNVVNKVDDLAASFGIALKDVK